MHPNNRKRNTQFSRFLPSEIIADILSRLPIRSILRCRCVCKAWLNLLQSREFADFHLSRSSSGLVIDGETQWDSIRFKFFEFDDRIGLEHHDLHYNPLTELEPLDFMESSVLQGSANGLLLLCRLGSQRDHIYVCNPITREYIELPDHGFVYSSSTIHSYGFGVSKMTGQYKVVRIFHEYDDDDIGNSRKHVLHRITNSICLVYVLGSGTWRCIAPATPFLYADWSSGVFINGNLCWLVELSDGSRYISCFDLETEVFSTICLSALPIGKRSRLALVALGNFLCVCENRFDDEVVIWSMKGCGEERLWTKEFVIRKGIDLVYDDSGDHDEVVHPVKIFRDGDILMSWSNLYMFYYSDKTKTTTKIDIFGLDELEADFGGMMAMLHKPSFLLLGRFEKERVSRF